MAESRGGCCARLSKEKPEAVTKFDVPAGIGALRVAMNGEDSGEGNNDFDLLVFRGERATGATPVCKEDGAGQFAFCDVTVPASGRWSVVVGRKSGEGDVQISVMFSFPTGR